MHLDTIKIPVEKELIQFDKHFKDAVKSDISLLNFIMKYILRTKGKQLRPLIVFLSAKLHGDIKDSTFTAASLIELLHTATLIHDDVVDESFERRGFFSINALWKSKVAVLIGDYLLSKGLILSIEKNEVELLKIVTKAVKEMSEGELLQIQKSRKLNITEEDYFKIIRKKTATLIAACSACGAKSVDVPDEKIENMWQFGELLGIAFQIKDDLFDYDQNSLTGKPSGNDMKEKKLTLPLIYSLNHASNQEKRNILHIISKGERKKDSVKYVLDFVADFGGIKYTENKMIEYKNKAVDLLKIYDDNEALLSLKMLAEFIIQRKK